MASAKCKKKSLKTQRSKERQEGSIEIQKDDILTDKKREDVKKEREC